MRGTVRQLYHYPVKGLSPQTLSRVVLQAGCGFPFDREIGLARFDSGFDAADPRPLPKQKFLMLARDARLAELRSFYDTTTQRFTIHRGGRLELDVDLGSDAGAAAAMAFFSEMFGSAPGRGPMLARALPHRFTDVSVTSAQYMNAISLINLASVEDFSQRIGRYLAPIRFRANLYFDGWAPWSELDLVEREFRIGSARLRFLKRTQRCAATEVDPITAQRDVRVPQLLSHTYGHADMGVYAEVLEGADIEPGEAIEIDAFPR